MTKFERITSTEAREIFELWLTGEAELYTDKNNARYQIVIDELVGGRKILRALML